MSNEEIKLRWSPSLKISLCLLILNSAAYILLAFISLWPFRVFEFITPVKPLGEWRAGGTISYQMDVIKYKPIQAASTTYLKNDKFTIHVGSHPSNYPVGRRTSVSIGDLDPHTPPGKYWFHFSGVWPVNILNNQTVVSRSEQMVDVLPAAK